MGDAEIRLQVQIGHSKDISSFGWSPDGSTMSVVGLV